MQLNIFCPTGRMVQPFVRLAEPTFVAEDLFNVYAVMRFDI